MSEIVYFRYPMKNCQADSTIEGRRPTAPMLPRAYVCSREPSGAGWLAGPYRDARVVVKLKEPILKPGASPSYGLDHSSSRRDHCCGCSGVLATDGADEMGTMEALRHRATLVDWQW